MLYCCPNGKPGHWHHDMISHSVTLSWHWTNESLRYPQEQHKSPVIMQLINITRQCCKKKKRKKKCFLFATDLIWSPGVVSTYYIRLMSLNVEILSHFRLGAGREIAQAVEHSARKVWMLLHGGSLPFQPVVHNGCGMCCPIYGKVHIKHPLLLIEKSSLFGDSGFPLKK